MQNSNKNYFRYAVVGIVIVIIIIVLIATKGSNSPSTSTAKSASQSATGSSPAPAAVTQGLSAVSESTLNAIGTGTAVSKPIAINAPALEENGKPEILYEGAEYCPFCATERWAVAVALSQFGTFNNLKVTHSSTTDVYPNTQTLSFYGSTYSSNYIAFTPIEVYTNIPDGGGYTTLQTPTTAQSNIVNKYDATPYLPPQAAGSIPFIDFGGQYLIAGATYSPTVLQGKSASEIATSLSNVNSPIAKGADGVANTMISSICKLTDDQPTSACGNPAQTTGASQ